MQLVYMGHQVRGDAKRNAMVGLVWLAWLREMHPDVEIIAPWIAGVLSGEDDADEAVRARALRGCELVASRCDGIVLVGPRITEGMAREIAAVHAAGGWVSNLTLLGAEPPVSWDFEQTPLEVGLDVERVP